jgi:Tol biopolymer transport system component
MIAFTYGEEVRTINADGSGNRAISARSRYPAWSPDGRIVFVTDAGLTIANADGSGTRLLLRHNFKNADSNDAAAWPTWSPDGRRIAFLFIECCWEVPWQTYVINEDGSGLRPLIGEGQWLGLDPAWSPDGSRIAISSRYFEWGSGDTGASVSSVDTSGTGGMTHHVKGLATEWNFVGQPDWSPDGRLMAFSSAIGSMAEGAPPMRLHVVDIETGVTRQLIPDAVAPKQAVYQDSDVAWSRAAP